MKKFKHRPGVELLEISGEYLLVATGEARGQCNYVTQINQVAAEYWKLTDTTCSVNELAERVAEHYQVEKKNTLLRVLAYTGKMTKSGYLIEVGE